MNSPYFSNLPVISFKQIKHFFRFVAISLAIFQAWTKRFYVSPDGLSYLDVGEAYFQGAWTSSINGYWSPLYSWFQGFFLKLFDPAPQVESMVVHFVDFIIFVAALVSFEFLWRQLAYQQREIKLAQNRLTLPEPVWYVLGYTLFIWSSLNLISVWEVTPDMTVAAMVYLAAGILVRLRRNNASLGLYALFGTVLGIAYLTKAAMFPVAFIFLAVNVFTARDRRRVVLRSLLVVGLFLVLSFPFILLLSKAKDRLTFGDAGRLNYAWYVNGVPGVHWQGEDIRFGVPEHPTRMVYRQPAILEFATPVGGTYPPWYDPSYWYEGLRFDFDFRKQLNVLFSNLNLYFDLFFRRQASILMGTLIFFLMGKEYWSISRAIVEEWPLLLLGMIPLVMYALIHIEMRFLSPFIILLWAGLLSSVRLPNKPQLLRFVNQVALVVVFLMMVNVIVAAAELGKKNVQALINWRDVSTHEHWQVATGLHQMGVQKADKVAFMGYSFNAYWARLAEVKIIADIFDQDDVDYFWTSSEDAKAEVMEVLANTGAEFIVTKGVPHLSEADGWEKVMKTDYYLYRLYRLSD